MRATINGKWVTDRDSLHALLRKKLNLPEDCGRNLDAVFDVLTDPGKPLVLTVKNEALLKERLGDYGERLLAMLDRAGKESSRLTVLHK